MLVSFDLHHHRSRASCQYFHNKIRVSREAEEVGHVSLKFYGGIITYIHEERRNLLSYTVARLKDYEQSCYE